MTVAPMVVVPGSHHVLHDFVGPFDVMVSFLEAGIHGAVMVTRTMHHGWMA
jgi:hypothetical protein